MALTPVEFDPFATQAPTGLTPVEGDPFAAQPEPEDSLLRTTSIFSRGALDGAARTVDAALNAPVQAFNLLKAAAGIGLLESGAISSPEGRDVIREYTEPTEHVPIVERALRAVTDEGLAPQTRTERFAKTTGEFAGSAAASGGLTPAAATRPIVAGAPAVTAVATKPAVAMPIASAVGAGVGTQTAREVAPGSLPAEIVGGVLGGLTPDGLRSSVRAFTGNTPAKQKVAEEIKKAAGVREKKSAPAADEAAYEPQKTKKPERQQIIDDLGGDITDDSIVSKYIIRDGKPKLDPLGAQALKQGASEGFVADIKLASPATKSKILDMLDVAKKGRKSQKYADLNRPSDIGGAALIDRVRLLERVNKDAGARLDKVARESLTDKPVDISGVSAEFRSSLDDLDIKIGENGALDFSNSILRGERLKPLRTAVQDMAGEIARIESGGGRNAYDLHKLKKYIDEQVSFGAGTTEGLSAKTERIMKNVRASLDEALDLKFPEYDKVNTVYSETIRPLKEFEKVIGSKIDLSDENAFRAVGTSLRGITSNRQGRVPLINAINRLDGVSKKYGGKFADDVSSLVSAANEIEEMFGTHGRTTFRAEVGKGASDAAGVAFGRRGLREAAANKGLEVLEKARGINEDNAFKAIEDLLKRNQSQ